MSSTPSLLVFFENWFHGFPIMSHQGASLVADTLGSFIINLAFVLMVLESLWLEKKSDYGIWKCFNNNLAMLFVLMWTLCFNVYDVALTGDEKYLLHNTSIAVQQSFGSFLLNYINMSAIQTEVCEDKIYTGFFSVAHSLFALVSLVFVIEHFGYNIIVGLNKFTKTRFNKSKKEIFIFWGINDDSFQSDKSIQANDTKGYRIKFVQSTIDIYHRVIESRQ